MKDVPFYANHEDELRCQLACYRMIVEYFEDKKLSWEEMAEITGFRPGRVAWTAKPLVYFAKHGYDIKMIEPFDYARYYSEGESYLAEALTPEELQWQLENSNILEIKPDIPEFLQTVDCTKKVATLGDIDKLLSEDRLVTVVLNSRELNNKPGYDAHAILVFAKHGEDFVAHDPGGVPGRPGRVITSEKLLAAMGGENNNADVTGFKLKVAS